MVGVRVRRRDTVYQITGARRGVRDDVNSRTRRYLISMGVRTACFIGAVLVGGGWLRWDLGRLRREAEQRVAMRAG